MVFCGISFASLPDKDGDPRELVSFTYQKLLDQLGREVRSNAELETIAASANPFDIAEPAGKDLGPLRKSMREFEAMLAGKGWRTDAVVDRIRADLRVSAQKLQTTADLNQDTLEKNLPDIKFDLPYGRYQTASPDARWILADNWWSGPQVGGLNIYDTRHRKLTFQPSPPGTWSDPTFSHDGKHLMFVTERSTLLKFPFQEGIVDWSKGKESGSPTPSEFGAVDAKIMRRAAHDDRILAGPELGYLFLHDPAVGTRHKIEVRKTLTGYENAVDVGLIPKTDLLYFVIYDKEKKLRRIQTYQVSADGKLVPQQELGSWVQQDPEQKIKAAPSQVNWLPNGKLVLTFGQGEEKKAYRQFRVATYAFSFA